MAGKEVVLARYRRLPGFVVLLYLCLLVIPWLFTYIQSSSPFRLTVPLSQEKYKYDVNELGIQLWDATFATNWTYALEVLTVFAGVVALPVIYMLLARAAVVFTLRTRATKKVSARQLFSLADGRYLQHGLLPDSEATWLTRFGAGLILIAYPLSYDGKPSRYNPGPNGRDQQQIGPSPGLAIISDLNRTNIVQRTLHSVIIEQRSQLSSSAWYDDRDERYFVTALPRNTSTGLFRQVALRMDSNARCENIREDEFPTPCPGTGFPYARSRTRIQEDTGEEFISTSTVDVCVFTNPPSTAAGADYTSPWSADTNDTQYLEEEMYIRVKYPVYQESWVVRCVGNTTLGYFELGNFHNGGEFSQTIKNYSEYAKNTNIVNRRGKYWYDSDHSSIDPNAELDHVRRATPGPLTIAALALFGNGSFYDLAARVGSNNATDDPLAQALGASCPFPFKAQLSSYYQDPCDMRYGYRQDFPASTVNFLVSLFNPDWTNTNHLEVAMYLANQALMDTAASVSQTKPSSADYIWTTEGLQYRQFVMSTATLVVVSVLVALQALGMIVLLVYSYRVPTWTSTLDALAIARITYQLKDGDFIRWIGLQDVSWKQRKELDEVNGLIGIVERPPNSALPPNPQEHSTSAEDTAALVPRSSTAGCPSSVTQAEEVQTTGRNSFGQGQISQTPPESPAVADDSSTQLHPRMSLNIGDNEFEMDDLEVGRQSPPAYTPRHPGRGTDPIHAVGQPPDYTATLAINELRVGARGIVTRMAVLHSRPGLAAAGGNV
ncbi:hypothetical protein B0H66DRAFT_546856 [Apodospora peruviana]|uniref:Uncharacterized protein n=1 Tax=Apodospora peruviana TaxID=516989 RepID=A0AAE0IH62_9PEZI|nr:hypothetical protein B0H66DRAFT_546856 [Apodospora peruviana]